MLEGIKKAIDTFCYTICAMLCQNTLISRACDARVCCAMPEEMHCMQGVSTSCYTHFMHSIV